MGSGHDRMIRKQGKERGRVGIKELVGIKRTNMTDPVFLQYIQGKARAQGEIVLNQTPVLTRTQ